MVLPVPGGPTSRMPFGTRAPAMAKRRGSFRNCTVSRSSSFASSTPATSANTVLVSSGRTRVARPMPKNCPPLISSPPISRATTTKGAARSSTPTVCAISPPGPSSKEMATVWARSSFSRSSVTGMTTR